MPAAYEKIRDSYIAAGKPASLAKRLAAMTYNARRKAGEAPVTGNMESEGPLARIARGKKSG